jgi:hypothetical protein
MQIWVSGKPWLLIVVIRTQLSSSSLIKCKKKDAQKYYSNVPIINGNWEKGPDNQKAQLMQIIFY